LNSNGFNLIAGGNHIMKILRFYYILSFLLLMSFGLNAQIISLDKNPVKDSTEVVKEVQAFDLEEVNAELYITDDLILQLSNSIDALNYSELESSFIQQSVILEQEAQDFRSYNPFNLSKFFLNNIFLVWSNYRIQFEKWQKEIETNQKMVSDGIKQLSEIKRDWKLTYASIDVQTHSNLNIHIVKIINELDSLKKKFIVRQSYLIPLQTRLEDKVFLCDQILSETVILQESLKRKTFSKTERSLWNINLAEAFEGSIFDKLTKAWTNNYKSARYYFSSVGYSAFGFILWSLLISAVVLLLRKRYLMLNLTSEKPGHINIERVLIKQPYYVLTATLLLLWVLMFPFIPLLLSDVLSIGIILSLSFILRPFIDNVGKRVLKVLLLLLFLNIFELVFWYLADFVRLYLLLETSIALVIVFRFFLEFNKRESTKEKTRILVLARKFIPFLFGFYAIAFIANVFGFVNLTVILAKIGIRTVAMTMIAYGYLRIFETISSAGLSIMEAKFPNFSMRYIDVIRERTLMFIKASVLLLWLRSILAILEVRQEFLDWAKELLTTELQIGSLSISLSNIFLFIIILFITYGISVFTKKIIEKEILQSIKMPRGGPAAISMILRIFFVSIGVVFAISAAGIDMGKFGMIAGALGVGIGFGLQNIVQNFISGLILIFERPIQVGDTVEVDSLLGKVKDIGVRASNVVTYDGAEVVVPNSNLVSNNLINWTLSDSRKRIELNVGTSYGTDPNEVLEILKKVAVAHPNVVKKPEPLALFDGFGDSSLDFRLLFWVSFEFGLVTKSDVAIGIYNQFAENNIEIPFPQVDLHVKDIVEKKEDILIAKKKTKEK